MKTTGGLKKKKEGAVMDVEKALANMDFSRFSKKRASLKVRLMEEFQEELSMDDLGYVAAAGTAQHRKSLADRLEKK